MKTRSKIATIAFSITILATGSIAIAEDRFPAEWMPWVDPNNPDVIVLDSKDPTNHTWNMRRDTSEDPKREPGLVNPQRYEYGINTSAFPTYFQLPMAFNPEDLKAGNVDVALFGSTIDAQYLQGAKFAANRMRALHTVSFYPTAAATDPVNRVNYFEELNIVDYGNVASHIFQNQRSLEELATVIDEVQEAGAIPVSIGGTHIEMYAWFMALAKKYGAGNYVMFHIDAHYDTQDAFGGVFVHNGSMIREAVERGLIIGSDIIQFGLRSPVPTADEMQWMKDNQLKFHFDAEVMRYGFDKVAQRIFKELKGKKVFISFDMDGVNPSEAPAVGTMAIGGPSATEVMRLIRGIAQQNEIVGAEFGEYNPLMDDAHNTTGIVMDRMIRSLLAGIAARRQGITDPNYIAAEVLDHRVRD